jgi:hypothetical protein
MKMDMTCRKTCPDEYRENPAESPLKIGGRRGFELCQLERNPELRSQKGVLIQENHSNPVGGRKVAV